MPPIFVSMRIVRAGGGSPGPLHDSVPINRSIWQQARRSRPGGPALGPERPAGRDRGPALEGSRQKAIPERSRPGKPKHRTRQYGFVENCRCTEDMPTSCSQAATRQQGSFVITRGILWNKILLKLPGNWGFAPIPASAYL